MPYPVITASMGSTWAASRLRPFTKITGHSPDLAFKLRNPCHPGAVAERAEAMNEIFWPKGYVPGFSDNVASNEIIVAGLNR
jgi:hypothetical protein